MSHTVSGPPVTLRDRFGALPHRSQRLLIGATLVVACLSLLDATVIGTAIPRIVAQLGGDPRSFSWVVTGFLLTSTVSMPLYGRYSDIHGRRPVMLLALTVFLAGSVLCATATSMTALAAFRALQGVGAGGLMTVGMALMFDAFPWTSLARLQTAMGTMMAAAFIGGPYLGGLLTDLAGWRSVFLVNLAVGVPAMVVIAALLPGHRDPDRPTGRPDLAGMLLLVAGLTLLLFGLTVKGQPDPAGRLPAWSDPAVAGCLAAAALLLATFLVVETRAGVPILPLAAFRRRTYSAALVAGLFFSVAMFPAALMLPLYFQSARGTSASMSGILMLPLLVGLVVSNRVCAPLVWRPGWARRTVLAGAVLLGAGTVPLAFTDADSPLWTLGVCSALLGLGVGPSMAGTAIIAQNSAPPDAVGTAMSSSNLLKAVGQVAGLAVAQTILAHVLSVSGPQALARAVTTAIVWVGGVGALGTLISALLIENLPMRRTGPPGPGGGGPGGGGPGGGPGGPGRGPVPRRPT
ncbi:MFS transporter [Virgisporangium aurantiacum]|uniref:MFS transporter n=1 Tax=Virgisporangium aurantiacum TaxID=175570 RepID=A0A8J3ZFJ2_9ACTN|nr:MFS transporter [Virgisporangium aurantiacum]GIJ60413.1 MFS transporter [Virgisporangium aurantiacum]